MTDPLNHFAVIRTTFENIDVFPDDDALKAEMFGIVDEAYQMLVDGLHRLADWFVDQIDLLTSRELSALREMLHKLATEGESSRWIDRMMRVDVCEQPRPNGSRPVRSWLLEGRYEPLAAERQEDVGLIAAIFREIAREMGPPPVRTREAVDTAFKDYILVLVACFATIDPTFLSRCAELEE